MEEWKFVFFTDEGIIGLYNDDSQVRFWSRRDVVRNQRKVQACYSYDMGQYIKKN